MKLTNHKAKCIENFDDSNRIIIDRIYDVYEDDMDNYFIKDEYNNHFYMWSKFLKLMSIEESRNHTIEDILK